jgi:uncharacterized membrane protein SirB2
VRALVPLLLVGGVGLLGLRLYLSYTRNVQDASRAGKILWRILDVLLIILGAAAAVALLVFLIGVIGQVWQNVT